MEGFVTKVKAQNRPDAPQRNPFGLEYLWTVCHVSVPSRTINLTQSRTSECIWQRVSTRFTNLLGQFTPRFISWKLIGINTFRIDNYISILWVPLDYIIIDALAAFAKVSAFSGSSKSAEDLKNWIHTVIVVQPLEKKKKSKNRKRNVEKSGIFSITRKWLIGVFFK